MNISINFSAGSQSIFAATMPSHARTLSESFGKVFDTTRSPSRSSLCKRRPTSQDGSTAWMRMYARRNQTDACSTDSFESRRIRMGLYCSRPARALSFRSYQSPGKDFNRTQTLTRCSLVEFPTLMRYSHRQESERNKTNIRAMCLY